MSYVTVDQADDYFYDNEDWLCLSNTIKLKYLDEATDLINNLNFKGDKYIATQLNEFPRDTEEVPADIKVATYEIARNLIDGTDIEIESENLYVQSQSYGALKVSYIEGQTVEHMRAGIPSFKAWLRLKPYLKDPRKIILKRN